MLFCTPNEGEAIKENLLNKIHVLKSEDKLLIAGIIVKMPNESKQELSPIQYIINK